MTGSAASGGASTHPERGVRRLRASRDVRAVFATRQAAGSAVAVVHGRQRDDDQPPRVAVVAGRAVGNAVQRNRVKRRLRAAVAALALRPGADYVIVGRAQALTSPWDELRAALARCVDAVWARR